MQVRICFPCATGGATVVLKVSWLLISDGDYDSGDEKGEIARVLHVSEGCFAIVPDQDTAKPQRSYDVPHPRKAHEGATPPRSTHDADKRKVMMASKMVLQQSEELGRNAIALLRDAVFFLDRRAKIKQIRGVVSTVRADSCG